MYISVYRQSFGLHITVSLNHNVRLISDCNGEVALWCHVLHSGQKWSLRSSAHKRLSSLQKSAGRQLQRLQKAMSLTSMEPPHSAASNTTDLVTAGVDELSR